jgi:hypothetical protein
MEPLTGAERYLNERKQDPAYVEAYEEATKKMRSDAKYAVFKREDLIAVTDGYVTFKTEAELPDAVVIRRQDKFASPCLATYAAMISMVAMEHPNTQIHYELMSIADYFEDQARLAAEEGHKLPDR